MTTRKIPGYGNYTCSKNGEIFNLKGHSMKPFVSRNGYCILQLVVDGEIKKATVHSLIALTWISQRPKNCVINHINCNKRDNRLANLEYITQSENIKHARQNGKGLKGCKVYKLDIEGKVLEEYESILQACIATNINKSDISAVCLKKRNTAGGYRWCKQEDFEHLTLRYNKLAKPVLQYDKNGNFIKRFSTSNEAEKNTGVTGLIYVMFVETNKKLPEVIYGNMKNILQKKISQKDG